MARVRVGQMRRPPKRHWLSDVGGDDMTLGQAPNKGNVSHVEIGSYILSYYA